MHVGDGAQFVSEAAAALRQGSESGVHYDLAFIDTFNGNDDLPESLFSPGKPLGIGRPHAHANTEPVSRSTQQCTLEMEHTFFIVAQAHHSQTPVPHDAQACR